MANWSGSRHELKKINNIKPKASQKHSYYISDSSIFDYDSSLSSDSEWNKRRNPNECKEINKLNHVVENKINNKDQRNDTI